MLFEIVPLDFILFNESNFYRYEKRILEKKKKIQMHQVPGPYSYK